MKKQLILSFIATLLLAGGVQASSNSNAGIASEPKVTQFTGDSQIGGNIEVMLGHNNTLYVYHPERNECFARILVDGEIDRVEWGGNWHVHEIAPHSEDYSHVYLEANSTSPGSPSNIMVTVYLKDGRRLSSLFGVSVNSEY